MNLLPPGQRVVDGFPRFGVDLEHPPPRVPSPSRVTIDGELRHPLSLSAPELDRLPGATMTADFHCVAGWTSTGLTWQGWRFADVFHELIEPEIAEGVRIRHLVFVGADGFRSIVQLEDALGDDVLLADRLDGRPLTPEHGAPLRVVSPSQYGYISTKHLIRIELYRFRPAAYFHPSRQVQRALLAVHPHPRARVAQEERHRYLPSWLTRRIYRAVRLPAPLRKPDGGRTGSD